MSQMSLVMYAIISGINVTHKIPMCDDFKLTVKMIHEARVEGCGDEAKELVKAGLGGDHCDFADLEMEGGEYAELEVCMQDKGVWPVDRDANGKPIFKVIK